MKAHFQTILLVFFFATTCNVAGGTLPDGPYFGQTPPGLTAEVFAPGIISLPGRREMKIVFSPDGNECFIGTPPTILYTKQENGSWTEPVDATFLDAENKNEPFITPNGQKLFFIRWADVYVSNKVGGQWSVPSYVPSPVNTSAEEWHPTAAANGTLYFCSSRNSPPGYYNIYRSVPVGGQYTQVEQLDSTINSSYGAWDPFIAPAQNYLIFSTSRPDGFGDVDQHISYRKDDGSWTYPKNLGPAINTSGIDYGSYISYDGKYYFFSRPEDWGSGEADIYWVDARAIFPEYDFIRNGKIDFDDFAVLAAHWLTNEPSVDIAPETPDGIIDFLDLEVLAQHWLETSY
jgi:hypothetical protein